MGQQAFLYDTFVKKATHFWVTSYHPSFPFRNVLNMWLDYPWRSRYGAGSGWGNWYVREDCNRLDFRVGTTLYTVNIASGDYSAYSMASAIQAAMNAVGSGLTFTVSYSDLSNKFTISANGTFSLLFGTGPNKNISIHRNIGFSDSDKTGSSSYTADEKRIHGVEYFYIMGLPSAVEFDTIVFLGCNLTSAYQTLILSDNNWYYLGAFSYDSSLKAAICLLPSPVSRTGVIGIMRDWMNPDGYIQIGTILIGKRIVMSRGYEYGSSFRLVDSSSHIYSKKGYLLVSKGFTDTIVSVTYVVTASDSAKLRSLYKEVGMHTPFVFIEDLDKPLTSLSYNIMVGELDGRREDYLFDSINLTWRSLR